MLTEQEGAMLNARLRRLYSRVARSEVIAHKLHERLPLLSSIISIIYDVCAHLSVL